ncbi:MAG: hypothetical protein ACLTAN_02205 [Christensenellaceae bacterium]
MPEFQAREAKTGGTAKNNFALFRCKPKQGGFFILLQKKEQSKERKQDAERNRRIENKGNRGAERNESGACAL